MQQDKDRTSFGLNTDVDLVEMKTNGKLSILSLQ